MEQREQMEQMQNTVCNNGINGNKYSQIVDC